MQTKLLTFLCISLFSLSFFTICLGRIPISLVKRLSSTETIPNEILSSSNLPTPVVESNDSFKLTLEHHHMAKPVPEEWPRSLVSITASAKGKETVKQIVPYFPPENFTIVLFVYDNSNWFDVDWFKNLTVVYVPGQFKMWSIKRFFTPAVVKEYEYIFVVDEDVDLSEFDSLEFLKALRAGNISIGQPSRSDVDSDHQNLRNVSYPEGCQIVGRYTDFVEIGPMFAASSKIWDCMWNIMQNDMCDVAYGPDLIWCNCGTCGVVDAQKMYHTDTKMATGGPTALELMVLRQMVEIQDRFPMYNRMRRRTYGYWDMDGNRYSDKHTCKVESIPIYELQLRSDTKESA